MSARALSIAVAASMLLIAGCSSDETSVLEATPASSAERSPENSALVADGKQIFRFETYNDETFWTDTLHLQEAIRKAVSPTVALSVGLKVDADALPAAIKAGIGNGTVDLKDPATTVALLKLGAVVGVVGHVNERNTLTGVGITCAFCHSTVDNSFAPGIGRRLDGWPNRDLNVGAIVALSPVITAAQKAVYQSWGPGKYDPRFNVDGKNMPVVIPPAFGLRNVEREIYTGDAPISYWNAYVAITQMHGHGQFADQRIGVSVNNSPELVAPKLPALRAYQLSLVKPAPVVGAFDAEAARRGRMLFDGAAKCASCHVGSTFTDVNQGVLHTPAQVGQSAAYAARSATKQYRTTPLRGLWHPPQLKGPYFHDGSAVTLNSVVEHYMRVQSLVLTAAQRADLVEYLKSL
jgi:cytochrome c553